MRLYKSSFFVLKYPNNFNLLRFILSLLVVLSHSYQITGNIAYEPFYTYTDHFSTLGQFSVYIFFIISGYLITKSYCTNDLLTFSFARIKRIYPGLVIVILFTISVGATISTCDFISYLNSPITYSYLLNIFCLKLSYSLPGLFVENPIDIVNGSLWTLPYELYCYFFLAFLGEFFFKKNYFSSSLMLIISLVFFISIGLQNIKILIVFTAFFLSGSLFYIFIDKIPRNRWVFLMLFLLTIVVVKLPNLSLLAKKVFLMVTLPYITFFIAFGRQIFGRTFNYLGDISFGIYIYGFFIQQIIFVFTKSLNTYLNLLLSIPIILLLSFASFIFVERRFIKRKI